MPEFGANLQKQIVWEWKPYYMNYDRLKGWIKELESSNSEKAVKMFYEELELSVERVHQFYISKEKDIQGELSKFRETTTDNIVSAEDTRRAPELLQELTKLRLFATQNQEGFRKISKKFDKNVKSLAKEDVEKSPKLQDRVVGLVRKFPFANAEQRLAPLIGAVEGILEGREVILEDGPKLSRRFSKVDLGEPLLLLPRGESSASFAPAVLLKVFKQSYLLLVMSAGVFALAKYNPTSELTPTSYLVIWVTAIVLTFLVRQYPPDMVLMAATLFLTVCGVLTEQDAWAAFSNDVVLSVAGLGVVAHAVENTGVIDIVFGALLGKPQSLPVAMLRLFVPAVFLNVCISNTCVMSCLLTVIDKWSVDIGYSKAYFLMPLSYMLLISGTFATFTTSTNLIAQGQLIAAGYPGFDTFALSKIATACTLVSIAYLILIAPVFLRRFGAGSKKIGGDATKSPAHLSRRHQNRYDVRVQISGRALTGESIRSSGLLAKMGAISDVIACERYGKCHQPVEEEYSLRLDDVLWLRTNVESVASLFHTAGVVFLALDLSDEVATFDPASRDLVEAVLDKESPLVGHRIGHARKYRPEYDCPIVAFRAFNTEQGDDMLSQDGGTVDLGATPETRLQAGDHILLNTPMTFYNTFKDSQDFVVLRKVAHGDSDRGDTLDNSKAIYGGAILMGLVALVSTSTLQLLEAVFLALAALICTRCTTMDSCVRAVKLRTVLTIVGAFGLGKAIGQEGVAKVLAEILIFLLGPFGVEGILIAVFGSTVALGIIFHGTAVVVLMFPICRSVSDSMGIPIHQLVAVLCLSVSCQMLSPISYQTNLMAYSTGGYQFADFTKVGMGLVICIAVVAIPMCQWTFPG